MFMIGVGVVFAATVLATRPATITLEQKYGPSSPDAACPHCAASGGVHSRTVKRNGDVSMPKVITGALTGGLALLAVGFHRRVSVVQRHCVVCDRTWLE